MDSVKKIIHKILRAFGYTISKTQPEMPATSLESIRLILLYNLNKNINFVQIGSCDGVSNDAVHDIILRGKFNALLVEPMPDNFDELVSNYKTSPNASCINAAIGLSNGSQNIYYIKNQQENISEFWSKQLPSFNKNNIIKHGVKDSDIDVISVKTITLSQLMHDNNLEKIDILQTDTEGFDAKIVNMALDLKFPPPVIYFEYIHIDQHELTALLIRLQEYGYKWNYSHWNILCVNEGSL